jgi:hypothetical protein
MPLTPQHIEACVDATAAALALPIAPEHRPGVLQFFALSSAMADQVMGLPLAVHDEPAPVFEPVAPEGRA